MLPVTNTASNDSCISCVTDPIFYMGSKVVSLISTGYSMVADLAKKIAAFIASLFSPLTNFFFGLASAGTGTSAPPRPAEPALSPLVPYVPTAENTRHGADFLLKILSPIPDATFKDPTDYSEAMKTPIAAKKAFARRVIFALALDSTMDVSDRESLPHFICREMGRSSVTFASRLESLYKTFREMTQKDQAYAVASFFTDDPAVETIIPVHYIEIIDSMRSTFAGLSKEEQASTRELFRNNFALYPNMNPSIAVLSKALREALVNSVSSVLDRLAPEDQGPARESFRNGSEIPVYSARLIQKMNEAYRILVPEESGSKGESSELGDETLLYILREALDVNFLAADNFLIRVNQAAEGYIAPGLNPDFIACAEEARIRHQKDSETVREGKNFLGNLMKEKLNQATNHEEIKQEVTAFLKRSQPVAVTHFFADLLIFSYICKPILYDTLPSFMHDYMHNNQELSLWKLLELKKQEYLALTDDVRASIAGRIYGQLSSDNRSTNQLNLFSPECNRFVPECEALSKTLSTEFPIFRSCAMALRSEHLAALQNPEE